MGNVPSDTCNINRSSPPFSVNLDLKELICTQGVFWLLVVLAFFNQIFRNFVWIWNAQETRETLALEKGDPKRSGKILKMLLYTLLSFILYIFAFLIIVGGNVYFLLAILCGNLVGTYTGMSHQKADEHISQSWTEMQDFTVLLKNARCDASNLSAKERRDICKFRDEFLLFIEGNESAQNIIESNRNNLLKF